MIQPTAFSALTTPLPPGSHLLEASAGTGKTYTIALLVLRFVVEFDTDIRRILVVTFTNAATEELKARIRARLSAVKRGLMGGEALAAEIQTWLKGLPLTQAEIQQRLAVALLDIDQAGIFTIHGFCQRVLRDFALESGQLADVALLGDISALKQACADDFWRRQLARPVWEVAVLTAAFATPEALLASLDSFPGAGLAQGSALKIVPEASDVDWALSGLKQAADQAQAALPALAAALNTAFADGKFTSTYQASFGGHCQTLAAWLSGECVVPPPAEVLAAFTHNGLLAGLNGQKFRSPKTLLLDERKAAYLSTLGLDCRVFEGLAKAYSQMAVVLRRALLETLRTDLGERLRQQNACSFDDLINRLADILCGDNGARLAGQLRQAYPVALIDEFQDTDQHQWAVFSRVFGEANPGETLPHCFLIGDPKQAIYKFRGADIYAYLAAHQQAQHHYTLPQNWRAHPRLVAAVNTLFRREQAFLLPGLTFYPAAAGLPEDSPLLRKAHVDAAPLAIWQLPKADSKTHWSAGQAEQAIQSHVRAEVLALLAGEYVFSDGHPVAAKDIAILVRTNQQARAYQDLLRAVGVSAILSSNESVFAAPEAVHLHQLLQAIAAPGDLMLLKQALTLDWLGLDGQALYQISRDEAALETWVTRFLDYHQDWQRLGVMAMMTAFLEREKVRLHLAQTRLAERQLTNIYHLLELLQQAVLDNHLGMAKTLDWLRAAIANASSDEHAQLRLESDEDAVQIITMHRAKGLEYPVVFCPYLWQDQGHRTGHPLVVCHEDGQICVDLGSDDLPKHAAQAELEAAAENLRLCYVALTRAKCRCYLVWANVRSENRPNQSALAWLLDLSAQNQEQQQASLENLAVAEPACFTYRLLPLSEESDVVQPRLTPASTQNFQARTLARSLYSPWQMSSYTALSALSETDAPELPPDKAREPSAPGVVDGDEDLPRGAHTGNVVHSLLETLPFARLARCQEVAVARDQACLRYGLKLARPECLDELLQTVVSTPLATADPEFCLKNLPENLMLKEMPFYLAVSELDTAHINRLLQGEPGCQALGSKAMSGFLTGFIDLICQYQGRFYVMDYKTNALPDYQPDTLLNAMREHNYGLQYWLYCAVLHRYLQHRLPGYDYQKHFGGVRYLFVRGMNPTLPQSGVYAYRPDGDKLAALAALLGAGHA